MTTDKEYRTEKNFERSDREQNNHYQGNRYRGNHSEHSPYSHRPSYSREQNNRGSYGNDQYGREDRRFKPNREDRYQGGNRPSYNKPRYGGNSYGNAPRTYNNRAEHSRPQEGNYRNYNIEDGYENRESRQEFRPRYNTNNNYRPRYNNNDGDRRNDFRPYGERQGQGNSYDRRPKQGFRPRTADYNPNAKYSHKKQIEYKEQFTDPDAPIRLNKFLANAGICSRREADEFITAGVVSVNGEIVTELGTKVKRTDEVKFHDQSVNIERKVYILLNKPKDCVTTVDDPQERKTVLNLVANACKERIYPVGRLDRNTTGVLLLTNDGEMASKLTHPKYLKKKIYHVYCDKNVTRADLDQILNGIELPDGEIHADAVSYASETDKSQVGIEIHSGRNRIVRRIFEALGYRVIKLDRVYFAGLTKKGLRRGDWRFLTEAEVNVLRMGAFE
ncbi:MAG: pseudouridine synthase [Phocaeicola sp.]|nr:rRNA pseudouridine synthase [Phocaeicola sp.]MDD7448337.1 pseudouridine synthase [Prevotellaceae bacterium]MDY3914966.1 pseudouridine synthase [Phocaeicola sp.]MDY5939357.1 pseudouridine synthase [Phocaeicola sp.]